MKLPPEPHLVLTVAAFLAERAPGRHEKADLPAKRIRRHTPDDDRAYAKRVAKRRAKKGYR